MGKNGVLPRQELKELFERGMIQAPSIAEHQLQPCSIDLRLGDVAYCVRGSFLPTSREDFETTLKRMTRHEFALSDDKPMLLERNRTYIVPLLESVHLPEGFSGYVNPKSTTGRADLLTRVICEGVQKFDTVVSGKKRKLFLEVTPLSFNVLVKRGLAVSQLRVRYGDGMVDEANLKVQYFSTPLLCDYGRKNVPIENAVFRDGGLELSVDLQSEIVAYRAKSNSQTELDLSAKRGALEIKKDQFWDAIERPSNGELVLEPGDFYLLATRERARFPKDMCGILDAYDVTAFEGRSHYAGFFDAGFGHGASGEVPGTPCTLEVRVRDAPFRITPGQPIGLMLFEKMRQDPVDDEGKLAVYGVGAFASNYQFQPPGPTLGKQFLPQ